ncbi:MAG: 4-(cytidine 5'-diphospho)-2-C-methyl-D-erythritol kinase [Planctomycetota bacterium]
MRPAVHALAPAKLNLALSVGKPDASGMHPISSWMVTVDLHDELHLEALEPDSMSLYAILWHADARRRTDIDWSISKDLAVRAHQALEARVGRKLPVRMRLEKRIPVGGGLGGGSSNAAAMLRALNELFELGLSDDALAEVARPLGSDVPFLVRGGSAIVEGLGERLSPAPLPADTHAVLLLPEASCPTGPVYRTFDALVPEAALQDARVRELAMRGAPPEADEPFNDLAEPALEVAPRLRGEREEVEEIVERPVHVSGSGSTLFFMANGPVESELLAQAVSSRLGLPAIPVRVVATPRPTWVRRPQA